MPDWLKQAIRGVLPLGARTAMASWFGRNRWFPGANRWAEGLIRELEVTDPKLYHKLKWEHHHASYGSTYEPHLLFGARKLNGTGAAYEAFLTDLRLSMSRADLPDEPLRILDVGCSVGHVLHALEHEVFTADGNTFLGIDIDRQAIDAGSRYLAGTESNVRLVQGDVEELDARLGPETFDFTFAAGSLSYLNTDDARDVVDRILDRTTGLVALVGLANPGSPNAELTASSFRSDFGSMWTHNFENMIEAGGWHVVHTRWQPPSDGDPQGLYMVFATPTVPHSA